MNIKDLMISDYVFHEKYGNAKVEMITNDFMGDPEVMLISENIKHKDGYEYGYCYSYPDEIYPIPLTSEILEKNRWGKNDIFMIFNEDPNAELSWTNRCGACLYKNGYHICDCNYVHQLQHALKLCGIEKEIIL